MTSREFIEKWFQVDDDKERWCSSIKKDGRGNIYSYGEHYPLLFTVNGQVFRNVAGYSVTTSKHIGWCYGFNATDVKLDRAAAQVVASSYQKDIVKLKEILRCLLEEQKELMQEASKKKRKNTQVFANIKRQFDEVTDSVNHLWPQVTGGAK